MRKKNDHKSKKGNSSKFKLDKNKSEENSINTPNQLFIEEIFGKVRKKYERVQKMGFELKLFAFESLQEEGNICFQKADYLNTALKFTEALSIYKNNIIEKIEKSHNIENLENLEKLENKNSTNASAIGDQNERIIQENILNCYLYISISYINLNEFEVALLISNECVRIFPGNAKALYRRAISRSKLYPSDPYQSKLALLDLKNALELSPENDDILLIWSELSEQYNHIQSEFDNLSDYENVVTAKKSLNSQNGSQQILENKDLKNFCKKEENNHQSSSNKKEKNHLETPFRKSKDTRENSRGKVKSNEIKKFDNLEDGSISKGEYICVPELERLQEIIEKGHEAIGILKEKKDYSKLAECEINILKLEGIRDYLLFIINSDIIEPTAEIKKKILSLGIDWDNPISKETIRLIRPKLITDIRKLIANELNLASKNSRLVIGKGVEIPDEVKTKLSLGKRVKRMVNFGINFNFSEKEPSQSQNQSAIDNCANAQKNMNDIMSSFKSILPKDYKGNKTTKQEIFIIVCFFLSLLVYSLYIISYSSRTQK